MHQTFEKKVNFGLLSVKKRPKMTFANQCGGDFIKKEMEKW